jgi:hypothetical protein
VAAGRVCVGAGAERAVGRDGAERPLDLDWRAMMIVWCVGGCGYECCAGKSVSTSGVVAESEWFRDGDILPEVHEADTVLPLATASLASGTRRGPRSQ